LVKNNALYKRKFAQRNTTAKFYRQKSRTPIHAEIQLAPRTKHRRIISHQTKTTSKAKKQETTKPRTKTSTDSLTNNKQIMDTNKPRVLNDAIVVVL
jgi:hypothetical protein